MTVKDLKERDSILVKHIQSLSEGVASRSDNPNFSDEEKADYDKTLAEHNELAGKIETQERFEKAKLLTASRSEANRWLPTEPTAEDKMLVFRAWALRKAGGSKFITRQMRDVVSRSRFDLDAPGDFSFRYDGTGQQLEDGNDSSYLQNGEIVQYVVEQLKAFGGLQAQATNLATADGAPLRFPTQDDTSKTGYWIDDGATPQEDDLAFGKITVGANLLGSAILPVSISLLQDSRVDLKQFVFKHLATRLGRAMATAFCTGDGDDKPTGLTVDATVGQTTASSATVISVTDMQALIASVDPAYLQAPGAGFLMNNATYLALTNLVDDDHRPVYVSGLQGWASPMPKTWMGYPIYIDQGMPNAGSTTTPIAFGDLSAYLVRTVQQIDIRVMSEVYLRQYALGFVAFARVDGKLLNPNAVKTLKMHS